MVALPLPPTATFPTSLLPPSKSFKAMPHRSLSVYSDEVNAIALSQPLKEIGQNELTTLHSISPILSYPDYRASSLMVVWPWNSGNGRVGTNPEWNFQLTPAVANNFAYFYFPSHG